VLGECVHMYTIQVYCMWQVVHTTQVYCTLYIGQWGKTTAAVCQPPGSCTHNTGVLYVTTCTHNTGVLLLYIGQWGKTTAAVRRSPGSCTHNTAVLYVTSCTHNTGVLYVTSCTHNTGVLYVTSCTHNTGDILYVVHRPMRKDNSSCTPTSRQLYRRLRWA